MPQERSSNTKCARMLLRVLALPVTALILPVILKYKNKAFPRNCSSETLCFYFTMLCDLFQSSQYGNLCDYKYPLNTLAAYEGGTKTACIRGSLSGICNLPRKVICKMAFKYLPLFILACRSNLKVQDHHIRLQNSCEFLNSLHTMSCQFHRYQLSRKKLSWQQ